MKQLLIMFVAVLLPPLLFSQAQIVFNGAQLVISNNANLVVQNSAPNALTVLSGGGIISEAAENNVVWNIGTHAGFYSVPFLATDGTSIPVSFTTSGASGSGSFILSTYSGAPDWKNSDYLPPTVTNVNRNGMDNSQYVIDRFWQVNATGYATKPSLSNFTLSYRDLEWSEPSNTITEANLAAQNWNTVAGLWTTPAVGTDNSSSNNVTVPSVSDTSFYPWWTLVDSNFTLPVALISFTAQVINNTSVLLNWKTATEVNTGYFTVEKTKDMNQIAEVGTLPAAGNSSSVQNYSLTDVKPFEGTSYYRLKTTDKDGRLSYSQWQMVNITATKQWQVYPNPVTDRVYITGDVSSARQISLQLMDLQGRMLTQQSINNQTTVIPLSNLAPGNYIISINDNGNITTFKIIKR